MTPEKAKGDEERPVEAKNQSEKEKKREGQNVAGETYGGNGGKKRKWKKSNRYATVSVNDVSKTRQAAGM